MFEELRDKSSPGLGAHPRLQRKLYLQDFTIGWGFRVCHVAFQVIQMRLIGARPYDDTWSGPLALNSPIPPAARTAIEKFVPPADLFASPGGHIAGFQRAHTTCLTPRSEGP
ncbi:hypothetical protein PIB30_097357 [Stylosanthes scabra]|uniref:Uncharacterized protein n=1 Tax=Stylosanthes scabra TaxID=79078 RepID=A0ABU6SWL2_9FABA|nr:hypothetical protein [Stylosanthes scabra]